MNTVLLSLLLAALVLAALWVGVQALLGGLAWRIRLVVTELERRSDVKAALRTRGGGDRHE